MTLDLLTSVELTISAAILVATASILVGPTPSARLKIAAVLIAWFCAVSWIGATALLAPQAGPAGLAGLGLTVFAPILAISLAVYSSATLKSELRKAPVTWLVAINGVRILGASFLLLSAAGRVAPTFAACAGWGDIFVGITALPVAWFLSKQRPTSHVVLLIWNIIGLLDLVLAVGLGITSSPGPLHLISETADSSVMTTLPWLYIPGFLVPLLTCSHLAIFWRSRQTKERAVVAAPAGMKTV